MDEAFSGADGIIAGIKLAHGIDYSAGRDEIARVIDEDIYNGNWDTVTEFDPSIGLRDLRIIEENEYDQSMDEDDDRPDNDKCLGLYGAGYVWFADNT